MLRESARRYSFMYSVHFKYFSTRFTFPLSYSSGDLALVVRKSMRGCMSRRALIHRNSNWDIVCRKCCECSSGNSILSLYYHTVNIYSAVYVAEVLRITSGKSLIIIFNTLSFIQSWFRPETSPYSFRDTCLPYIYLLW